MLRREAVGISLAFLALLSACGGKSDDKSVKSVSRLTHGYVVDEAGGKIAGARVCSGASGSCVASDGNGQFALTMQADAQGSLVANVSAPGYTSVSRRFSVVTDIGSFFLRKLDAVATVTMPTSTQDPVEISFSRDGGNMKLAIRAQSLIDASGKLVTGDVEVNLGGWNGYSDPSSYPGALFAEGANTGVKLYTYGMAHIEIYQDGNKLQVSPGEHLVWTVQEPNDQSRGAFLSADTSAPTPNLYSLSETTGQWHLEGTLDGNIMAYDKNSATFTMKLPHLSSWNADGTQGGTGGCISGYVYSPCDTTAKVPMVGKLITLWTMSFEETRLWYPSVQGQGTDLNGRYCVNIPIRQPTSGASGNNLPNTQKAWYFVAARGNWRDTSMTNPYASHGECFGESSPAGNCEAQWQYYHDDYYSYFCSRCVCNDCFSSDLGQYERQNQANDAYLRNDPAHPYQELQVSGAATADLTADGPMYGPQGTPNCFNPDACAQAPDVYMTDSKCPSIQVSSLKVTDPCINATTGKRMTSAQGDACGYSGFACCDSATTKFHCADFVCIQN